MKRRKKKPVRQAFQARSRLINRSARARLTSKSMSWYVLVTMPQEDLAAQRILRDMGYLSVLPLDFNYRRANRYDPAKMRVVNPAMPGYMFLGFEKGQEDWLSVLNLRVVLGALGSNGEPARVNGEDILTFLQSGADKWAVPGEYRYMRSNREFGVGDPVEIVIGPFAGQIVDCKAIEGKKAQIRLEVFGGVRDMVFPLDGLELAE